MALLPDPRDLLTLLPRAMSLLGEIEQLLARVEQTRQSADVLVGRISETVDRIEEPIHALQPVLERLAETTAPHEVDALVTVVDQLPELAAVVGTMSTVAPDLHQLLRTSVELNEMLAKIPFLDRGD